MMLRAWLIAALFGGGNRGVAAFVTTPPSGQRRGVVVNNVSPQRQLALGGAGLASLFLNRVFLAPSLSMDSQSRVDLLCLCAMCGLLLDGLSVRDVETRTAARVSLQGKKGVFVATNRLATQDELRSATWAAAALVDSLPNACTVVAWRNSKPLVRYGILGEDPLDLTTPTFQDALKIFPKETYLPDLQALPARVEFGCLPRYTPSALILPLTSDTGILLACDAKRALSPKDIAWVRRFAVELFSSSKPP